MLHPFHAGFEEISRAAGSPHIDSASILNRPPEPLRAPGHPNIPRSPALRHRPDLLLGLALLRWSMLPAAVRIAHAATAQLLFPGTLVMAIGTSRAWKQSPKCAEVFEV